MARQGRKQAKRLAARQTDWDNMKSSLDNKNKKGSVNGLAYRKPGSNKK